MHTPSHSSSIRVTAALRKYLRERKASEKHTESLAQFLSTLTVSQPKILDGGEPREPVTLSMVITGNVPNIDGYKPVVRIGNKFGKLEKISAKIDSIQGQIVEANENMRDCRGKLNRLLGKRAADQLIRERVSRAA